MKKFSVWFIAIISVLILGSCGKSEDIAIHGMKNFKVRGVQNGHILINLNLSIENPNNRTITISKIHFKAWLKNRELGTLNNSKKIVLKPNSTEDYEIPVEITLRTQADIFKLMNLKGDILDQLTIEGFIKGRSLCFSKKVKIEKQPFNELVKSYKGKLGSTDTSQIKEVVQLRDSLTVNDTLQTNDLTVQHDTLKVE